MAETAVQSNDPKAPPPKGQVTRPASFMGDFDTMFDRLARGMFPKPAWFQDPSALFDRSRTAPAPAADVIETDTAFEIRLDLPGMTESDVEVELAGDALTIKGEKSEEREERKESYHLSERRRGSFHRTFWLPDGIARDGIAATFDKGVLVVTVPKAPGAAEERKSIPITK